MSDTKYLELYDQFDTEEMSFFQGFGRNFKRKYQSQKEQIILLGTVIVIFSIIGLGSIFQLDKGLTIGALFMVIFAMFGLVVFGGPLLLLVIGNNNAIEYEIINRDGKYETETSENDVISEVFIISSEMADYNEIIDDMEGKMEKVPKFMAIAKKWLRRKSMSIEDQIRDWAKEHKYEIPKKMMTPEGKEQKMETSENIRDWIKKERDKRISSVEMIDSEEEFRTFIDTCKWLPTEDAEFRYTINSFRAWTELRDLMVNRLDVEPLENKEWKVLCFNVRSGFEISTRPDKVFNWIFLAVKPKKDEIIDNHSWTRLFPLTKRWLTIGAGMGVVPNVIKTEFKMIGFWRDHGPIVVIPERQSFEVITSQTIEEAQIKIEAWYARPLWNTVRYLENKVEELKETNEKILNSRFKHKEDLDEIDEYLVKDTTVKEKIDKWLWFFGGMFSLWIIMLILRSYGVSI